MKTLEESIAFAKKGKDSLVALLNQKGHTNHSFMQTLGFAEDWAGIIIHLQEYKKIKDANTPS